VVFGSLRWPLDEEKRRALRDIRLIGEGALLRLRVPAMVGQIAYRLEHRFRNVLGSAEVGGPLSIVRVQWPLWLHLTEEERMHVVAHEHAHVVTWSEFGTVVAPHGAEFQAAMALLGYRDAGDELRLNRKAQEFLRERGNKVANKNDKATLWVKDGYIFVKTPYNPEFVQELKADIPSSMRTWMGVDKVWRIAAAYHEDLLSVVKKHYGEPTILEQETQVVVVGDTGNDPFGAMLRVAPDDVLKKVYRMIAAEIHPDKGGAPEAMIVLNTAWSEIKKERKL